MGNNTSNPVWHAKATMMQFMKDFTQTNAKDLKKSKISTEFREKLNQRFNEMMEDFIVNNESYRNFSPEDKAACIGSLICIKRDMVESFDRSSTPWNMLGFLHNFYQRQPLIEIFSHFIASDFCYVDGQFYRWNDKLWEPFVGDISFDAYDKFNLSSTFDGFDFESEDIENGQRWFQSMMFEVNQTVMDLKTDLSPVLSAIKDTKVSLNNEGYKIPCSTMTIDFSDASGSPPSSSDFFTVNLPYDPVQKIDSVTEKFMKAFNCHKKDLANSIVRWGCRLKPTLTIVVGTGNNGKSTLTKYVQSLYGAFVRQVHPDDEGQLDQLVRTCFISEEEYNGCITNVDFITNFPCTNLVYVSNTDVSLPDKFGGRKVFKLMFTEPIAVKHVKQDILQRVTTRKQLGSGLRWCLNNYDKKKKKKKSIHSVEDLSQLLEIFGDPK